MQFKAQLNDLPQMIKYIHSHAKEAGIDANKIHKIELAAEEAIVNVISYAYPKDQLGVIELECLKKNKHFEITVKDFGLPFNPIESEVKVRKDLPPEQRPIGGLGIYLMRKLIDEVSYHRDHTQNANVLVMITRFE